MGVEVSGARTGRWNEQEHAVFLQGLQQHGHSWTKIAVMIDTRTAVQVSSHGRKYLAKMKKMEAYVRQTMRRAAHTNDDASCSR